VRDKEQRYYTESIAEREEEDRKRENIVGRLE
jgi:hypothetical protein